MREITATQIEQTVCGLLLTAHFCIDPAIGRAVAAAAERETGELPRAVLGQIAENYRIAAEDRVAICQDTGMTLVYAELGQEVHILGGFEAAVQAGVRRAHAEGYLRASVVRDPLFDRVNTGDGTPAMLRLRLVEGDGLRLTVVAKGFGSENNSALRMFIPAAPQAEIEEFIVSTVVQAAAKSCPPVIVGVGIGGTMEQAAMLAKRGTFRPADQHSPDARYAALEERLLARINASGVGPAGLGGRTTALAVNIEPWPTHIASIPVAVNLCCHASRHASASL